MIGRKWLIWILGLVVAFGMMPGTVDAAPKEKMNSMADCSSQELNAQQLKSQSTLWTFCWGIQSNTRTRWSKFNPDGSSTRDYGLTVPNGGVIKFDFHEVDKSPFDFTVTVYRENGGSVTKRAQNTDIQFTNMIGGNYSLDVTNNLGQPINVEFIVTSDPTYVPIPYNPTPVTTFTTTNNINNDMLEEITCFKVLNVTSGQSITVKPIQVEQSNYRFKVRVQRIGGGYVDHTFDQSTGQTTFTNMIGGQYKVYIQSLSGEDLYSTFQVTAHN